MNSNQVIKENWMSVVLLIVLVVVVLIFTVGRDRGQRQSFIDQPAASVGSYGDNIVTTPAPSLAPVQTSASATAAEAIQWCVLLDGANHIPDLFGEGIDNGGGGTNWHSYANDDPKGPQGVIMDGGKMVFFVKKSYLDSHGVVPSTAALKTSIAGWAPLTMSWASIGGEPALVYVK